MGPPRLDLSLSVPHGHENMAPEPVVPPASEVIEDEGIIRTNISSEFPICVNVPKQSILHINESSLIKVKVNIADNNFFALIDTGSKYSLILFTEMQ